MSEFPMFVFSLALALLLFHRYRGSYFYLAWQCAWIHFQKVQNQVANIFRLYFPGVSSIGSMIIKMCGHRARHDRTYFNSLLPEVEHDRLCKANQAKFACIVSSTIFKKVDSGQAGNGNDITFGFF